MTVLNVDKLHEEVVSEALRIFSFSPKWDPGIQNGKKLSVLPDGDNYFQEK
jgi:hypothetical protein